MRLDPHNELVLSATDVANHLGCHHLTELNRQRAHGFIRLPSYNDDTLKVLQELGERHEKAYVEHLAAKGLTVARCPTGLGQEADKVAWTIEQMRAGVPVIVQGCLRHENWMGYPDILRRVDRPSDLGTFSYEVEDTKLARQTRAGTVLQLCLYSQLVAHVQGTEPDFAWVVPRVVGFEREAFRLRSYSAYYRLIATRLSGQTQTQADTRAAPCEKCITCRWRPKCNDERRAADDLSLVAGLGSGQRRELNAQGISTVTELAQLHDPLPFRPDHGDAATFLRLARQARLQLASRVAPTPVWEYHNVEPGFGFTRLPSPASGDVFFDFEGDPWCGENGLEYLFGWVAEGPDGWSYHERWAFDEAQERRAFESTIDWLMARWASHPGMHVYHFGHYEPSAFKRLMGRYATREAELDRMLRGGLFVDLHTITRQGLVVGVESYSLKDLEAVHDFTRATALPDAGRERANLEGLLAMNNAADIPPGCRDVVREYNREDCESTRSLRDWLEARRDQLIFDGTKVPRPTAEEAEPSEEVAKRDAEVEKLASQLRAALPDDVSNWTDEHRALDLLADLLGYNRREDKCKFWEKFRLLALEPGDMFYERRALAGLEFVEEVPRKRGRVLVHRYRFPPQEVSIRVEKPLLIGEEKIGTLQSIDLAAHTVDIRKTLVTAEVHPSEVFQWELINSSVFGAALIRLGQWIRDRGIDADGPHRPARDLLLRKPPRLAPATPWLLEGEDPLDRAVRLCRALRGGVLGVQGPPGAGKTYTGAHIIRALVADGRRVGVTALSHKAIANLLREVKNIAPALEVGRKPGKADKVDDDMIAVKDNKAINAAFNSGELQVIGATAYAWAHTTLTNAVDVLIVDEASQLPLANTLAAAQGACNLVLLGDPAQLEQPQQASHPPGSEVSALTHLLGDAKTMPEDRGLFLPRTWRLHPDVCRFTSEVYYEGRLEPAAHCASQQLLDCPPFSGSGLFHVPVEHSGNQSASPEEVEAVANIVGRLLAGRWTDSGGLTKPMTNDDILIVTPFNDQLGRLQQRLPNLRIGTVDRFQGQQAPVVIYSMASSTPQDAPRGIGFLYDAHRMNVATSRARCACVLVASPALFEPDCKTPGQIELANGLCRFREMATETRLGSFPE